MGDITTTTAAIVALLIADASLTDNVLTVGSGTLDHVLESETVSYPAILVTYEGGEYGEHRLLGSRIVGVERTWKVYAIARAGVSGNVVTDDAANMLERISGLVQGVTVDSGIGELWPVTDTLVSSSGGVVVYSVDFKATTRTVGI